MAHGDDATLDALLLLADTDLVILDDRHLKAALNNRESVTSRSPIAISYI